MKDLLIFPAIVAILIVAIYFESSWLIIFLVLIVLRILFLKNNKLLLVVGIVAVIFFIRCQWMEKALQPVIPSFETAVLAPDKLSVNGDILSGELQTKKQSVRFIYRLKTENEQKKWKNQIDLIEASVKIGKISEISGPRNIGEFDFKKSSFHKNIHYMVELTQINSLKIHQPTTISEKINVLRIHIIQHLAKLPKWLKIHAQSLIVGYTENSNKDFLKILSVLGIIHLFSLSGLHVLIQTK